MTECVDALQKAPVENLAAWLRSVANDGDPTGAIAHATEALTSCSEDERRGLLTARGREFLRMFPGTAFPARRDLRELLMTTSSPEGTER